MQDRFEVESAARQKIRFDRGPQVVISIVEDRQTEDTTTFTTSKRDIATALANVNLMDSDRNIEILRVLNEVFDSIEEMSVENE